MEKYDDDVNAHVARWIYRLVWREWNKSMIFLGLSNALNREWVNKVLKIKYIKKDTRERY